MIFRYAIVKTHAIPERFRHYYCLPYFRHLHATLYFTFSFYIAPCYIDLYDDYKQTLMPYITEIYDLNTCVYIIIEIDRL